MSYDREIGIDPANSTHLAILEKLNLPPLVRPVKDFLPCRSREPEPKLLVSNTEHFSSIRRIFDECSNTAVIRDQFWKKPPLVSLLLDSKEPVITPAGYSLKYRFELDPLTGSMNNGDFNLKSCNSNSPELAGIIDRTEIEREVGKNETRKQGYESFNEQFQRVACSHGIAYENLIVYAAYITLRNEYPFIVKHPKLGIGIVFEACEDVTKTAHQRVNAEKNGSYFIKTGVFSEVEYEPKLIIGNLPEYLQNNPREFKKVLYEFMGDIQYEIHSRIPGSAINKKSKAQIAQENLVGFVPDARSFDPSGCLSSQFTSSVTDERAKELRAIWHIAANGLGLEDTLKNNRRSLQRLAQGVAKRSRSRDQQATCLQQAPVSSADILPAAGLIVLEPAFFH